MDINFVCENMSIFYIGSEHCNPGHSFSIGFTDRYLIHYIVSGKGKFVCDGKEYKLNAGNAFLITGEKGGYYEADINEPWYYIWFNISGNMAETFLKNIGLSRENPIYKTNNPEILKEHFESITNLQNKNNVFLISGALFTLLGEMIMYSSNETYCIRKSTEEYVNMCKNYIQINYYKKITVNELCSFVGLEHSYLYRLFKAELNISPCEYIINFKLARAENLLVTTKMSIGEIACAVGYEDKLAFSKLYLKKYGVSPLNYRKKNMNL